MTPTRLLSLALLAAFAAGCEGPVSPGSDAGSRAAAESLPRLGVAGRAAGSTWSPEPIVLDFESVATTRVIAAVGESYAEDGYTLAVTDEGVFSTLGSANLTYPGSAGLFVNDRRNVATVLTRDDGNLFSVQSIDLAPLTPGRPGVVAFVGTRADGSTVTQTVTTGTDPRFATYALEGFTGLVELRWVQLFSGGKLHQFDNIVLVDARAESRDDCTDGAWERYGFRNQGECIKVFRTL